MRYLIGVAAALALALVACGGGATANPPASMVCRARPSARPMSVMMSPLMAMSAA